MPVEGRRRGRPSRSWERELKEAVGPGGFETATVQTGNCGGIENQETVYSVVTHAYTHHRRACALCVCDVL